MRKLVLYASDNRFNNSIDKVTIQAFAHLADIPIKEGHDIRVLEKKEEAKRFLMGEWDCILERQSRLRKFGTLVAGATNILRFIYATEIVDYEYYP